MAVVVVLAVLACAACVPVAPGSLIVDAVPQALTATPQPSTVTPRPSIVTAQPLTGAPTRTPDTVTISGLHNCRADGRISAPVLAVLPDGALLTVYSRVDGWAQVVAAGTPCWVKVDAHQ
jgi:hypothetical protein